MPQIDSGLIIFNSLLTIGVLFFDRNSSKKDIEIRRFRPTNEEFKKHKGNWEKMFEGG